MRHATGRAIGALIATSLALGLLATPTAAGGSLSHYVGKRPPGGGSCASPDFQAIQPAIDAASPGDTIVVCPGVYRETVRIGAGKDGLTVRAKAPRKAVVRVPASPATASPAGSLTLIRVSDVDHVQLQGLKLVNPTGGACSRVDEMILIRNATRITVDAGEIRPNGKDTLGDTNGCGYVTGVLVQVGSTATVTNTIIQDFQGIAIDVEGGSRARIIGNDLRYHHANEGPESGSSAIRVYQATAKIRDNTIIGLSTALTPSGGPGTTPRLATAVAAFYVTGGNLVVRGNDVRYAFDGIQSFYQTGAVVRDNRVRDVSGRGLYINDSDDGRILANRVVRARHGLYLSSGSAGNLVQDNNARGNREFDCYDDSVGGGDGGTANTWQNDLGWDANVAGICLPGNVPEA